MNEDLHLTYDYLKTICIPLKVKYFSFIMGKYFMKKKTILQALPFLFFVFLAGCSSSNEVKNESSNDSGSVYVFDKIPSDTTINYSEPKGFPPFNSKYYVVQIGAFTTKDNAEKFAEKSQVIIEHKVDISFNPQTKFYVVQLVPSYKSRSEAEKMRDTLWQMKGYKDAWILTVNK